MTLDVSSTPLPPSRNSSHDEDNVVVPSLSADEDGSGNKSSPISEVEGSTTDIEKGEATYAECRICQEQDDLENLESPCNCSGSLKYAHRQCIQLWCDARGCITCEICKQKYRDGYQVQTRHSWALEGQQLSDGEFAARASMNYDRMRQQIVDAQHAARIQARITAQENQPPCCSVWCSVKWFAKWFFLVLLIFIVTLIFSYVYDIYVD